MPEILSSDVQHIRPLFHELERPHALVAAFFEGCATARLFVDDPVGPRTGIIVCNSRVLCAGDTSQSSFLNEMISIFSDELIPAHRARGNHGFLAYVTGDDWNAALEHMFGSYQLYRGTRQYYEMMNFTPRPDPQVPDGFSIHLITSDFMSSHVAGLDAVREEMCSERTSVEDFLARSFGICPVYENEVAGWCMSEYNVGDRCEIGIATAPDHRRKGIASLATQAFLNEAHNHGYERIGWDCWTNNTPSAATARKAGFKLIEEYPAIVIEF